MESTNSKHCSLENCSAFEHEFFNLFIVFAIILVKILWPINLWVYENWTRHIRSLDIDKKKSNDVLCFKQLCSLRSACWHFLIGDASTLTVWKKRINQRRTTLKHNLSNASASQWQVGHCIQCNIFDLNSQPCSIENVMANFTSFT